MTERCVCCGKEIPDEPHDRVFVWNVLCCIWEIRHHESENTSEVN